MYRLPVSHPERTGLTGIIVSQPLTAAQGVYSIANPEGCAESELSHAAPDSLQRVDPLRAKLPLPDREPLPCRS
jgi:hypothetical protein